ncbi:MFS transporter [Nocardiopsis lambiniae]|uniref:MFS transporter n=1 Tax=Nocardiopsis lambiniae TaxID=3075539 RepID=A0ABU2M2Z1_9ACTN|nr:MFS transporter [Nocardiopsis sp. DSM 44743]MDT0327019.1 MFS transporter [Nocardiopsis sp. DSM 44743]
MAASALVLALSGPGQTAGIAVFVDHVITDLDVGRSAVSLAYMVGTLTGALALPWIGRAVDRFGVRRVLALVALGFGGFLVLLAGAQGLVGLTAGFVGVRALGQGGLSMIATTAVAISVTRNRGALLGLTSSLGAAGISLFPLLAERVITVLDWRYTFVAEGILIWVVVLPLAWWGLRGAERPARDTAAAGEEGGEEPVEPSWPLATIARTSMFWAMAGAIACSGLVSTAVFFHQISLLGEQGLTPAQAAANFLPQTLAGLAAALLFGSATDRLSPKVLMSAAMAMHALALVALPSVSPGLGALLYGAALGAAAAGARAVESAALPFYFGTANLGTLRGLTQSVAVASTAVGPILLSLAHGWAGSYRPGVMGLAALCALVAVLVCFARAPLPAIGGSPVGSDEHVREH